MKSRGGRVETKSGLEELSRLLGANRYSFQSEAELHECLADVLDAAGVAYQREVRLSEAHRVDFMVGRLAVEVKLSGPLSALTRQVHGYLQHEEVDGVLVVAAKTRLAGLPGEVSGKPVRTLVLVESML